MKIYSWNMLFRNADLNRAFEFISHADFDIFCLQEVPEPFLKRLETLPFTIAYQKDVERLLPSGLEHIYVVVLSRYPILSNTPIPFPTYTDEASWRAKAFVRLMPARFFSPFRNRNGMYVDVRTPTLTVRIFNLHFILGQPNWRRAEFETAMEHRNELPTVACGDFNILEKPHIILLNWIFGARISDALFHRRERNAIESRFAAYGLRNLLRGAITHPLSRSQLDHILLSHDFSVQSARVIPDRYGSDHHPIFAEVI